MATAAPAAAGALPVQTKQSAKGIDALGGSAKSAVDAVIRMGTWAADELGEQIAQMRGAALVQDGAIPLNPYDIVSRNTSTSVGTKALVILYFGQCTCVGFFMALFTVRRGRRGRGAINLPS